MSKTLSPRYGTERSSAETDDWPARVGLQAIFDAIESGSLRTNQGTLAARPAAGLAGGNRVYWADDSKRLYWDNGSTWTEISPVGDGTVGRGATEFSAAAVAGTAGVSRAAARSDHSHPEKPWPVDYWVMRVGPTAGVYLGVAPGEHNVLTQTIQNGKAGLYQVTVTIVANAQTQDADVAWRVIVNDSQVDKEWPVDSQAAYRSTSVNQFLVARPAGDMTWMLRCNPTQNLNVDRYNTKLNIVYLGPVA